MGIQQNANYVVVAGDGTVYVAPTASAVAPTNAATALNAVWLEMGYVSEDGATFTQGQEITDINAWQSFYPIRRVLTARTVSISFALREWNKRAVEFATGGTVAINAAEWKLTPPTPSATIDRALILEWVDGSKKYRLFCPKGVISEDVETNLSRTAAADLPVTFAASDPGAGGSIYQLFTTDPAFSS